MPAPVLIVSVALLDDAFVRSTEVGLNVAFAPVGNPLALKLTVPVKPAKGVTVVMYWALVPGVTAFKVGVALTA